ncbi:MAG: sulfurtransferase [Calditrichaeota bacterium]|nr:MAG: sulfurtransferase [Calditrichota bacterium]
MEDYAYPDSVVSTDWVEKQKGDRSVVVVEVDVDTKAYDEGHIPGAVGWNWKTQLCDTVRRDIIPKTELEKLLSESGISPDTTIVLYGDNNNWFAAWAFWQLKMYGHQDVRLMDGGRKKWLAEGRELSEEPPKVEAAPYDTNGVDESDRIKLPELQSIYQADSTVLVDVRSPDEFSGKILSPPGLPETCQRGGHIPGAKNIGWGTACNEDGTFKPADELRRLYADKGVTPEKNVVTYCRIGERSSLSWFVLKYLLGYPNVRNYDGSWTEWGNLVAADIERGATS